MKNKRISPFSREFWVAKGMTVEEADFKRNSMRPIKKEYWMERGHSAEEAEQLAIDTKTNNDKKGAANSKNRPMQSMREASVRCIEYWLKQGYDHAAAADKLVQIQRTFTLEKCKERYGDEAGYKVWKARQDNWLATLNNKSDAEKELINSKKNSILPKESIEETVEYYKLARNMTLFSTIPALINSIREKIQVDPAIKYQPGRRYIEKNVPNIQLLILNLTADILLDKIDSFFAPETYLETRGKKQAYRKRVDEGLLRSSYEIYFYETFRAKYPHCNLRLDGYYPSSKLRFDFKIGDVYIEVCPRYETDLAYRLKMDKKHEVFGCILLKTSSDITGFIENLTL